MIIPLSVWSYTAAARTSLLFRAQSKGVRQSAQEATSCVGEFSPTPARVCFVSWAPRVHEVAAASLPSPYVSPSAHHMCLMWRFRAAPRFLPREGAQSYLHPTSPPKRFPAQFPRRCAKPPLNQFGCRQRQTHGSASLPNVNETLFCRSLTTLLAPRLDPRCR